MPIIKINRSSEYINFARNFQIFIDDKNEGSIANGETKQFTLSTGKHKVIAKIDWCSSREILLDINENDTKYLKVSGFAYSNWVIGFPIAIIIYSILNHTLDLKLKIIFALPIFILVLYLTIWRKKYLTLNEVELANNINP